MYAYLWHSRITGTKSISLQFSKQRSILHTNRIFQRVSGNGKPTILGWFSNLTNFRL